MKRSEILKSYSLNKLGNDTVFIRNEFFHFSYAKADSVVKEEYVGQYKYFGGLQTFFKEGSEDYNNLEKWLIEIAEKILNN